MIVKHYVDDAITKTLAGARIGPTVSPLTSVLSLRYVALGIEAVEMCLPLSGTEYGVSVREVLLGRPFAPEITIRDSLGELVGENFAASPSPAAIRAPCEDLGNGGQARDIAEIDDEEWLVGLEVRWCAEEYRHGAVNRLGSEWQRVGDALEDLCESGGLSLTSRHLSVEAGGLRWVSSDEREG